MNFRKDINGLRAIAVIAVVLFHFNNTWLPGGFAGVDVFFVISGFLMTGIIFRGIEQERFSIISFYVARANRIIPALAVLCLVLLLFGWFFLIPYDFKELSKHVASSIMFISNFIYWTEAGYFNAASQSKWLLHTWSLSAEWQFYIIYPLVLVIMRKFMTIRKMKATVLLMTILGFIFCVLVTYKWPGHAYYLLPTRAWEMMIGGVAFLYPLTIQEKRKKLIEWVGVGLIVGSYFFISEDSPWPGYLAIFPVVGTFLIIQAQRNNSFITSNVVFQKIGTWSYSIYLWHWPLVVAIYYFSLNELFIYFGILLSILLGYLSNKYIEKIKFNNVFKSVIHVRSIQFAVIVLFVSGYQYVSTDNYIKSHPSDMESFILGHNYLNELGEMDFNRAGAVRILNGSENLKDIDVLMVGDSNSAQYSYGITLSNNLKVAHRWTGSCFAFMDMNTKPYATWMGEQWGKDCHSLYKFVDLNKDAPVIISHAWAKREMECVNGCSSSLIERDFNLIIKNELKKLINYIGDRPIFIIGEVPAPLKSMVMCMKSFNTKSCERVSSKFSDERVKTNELLNEISSRYKNVFFINPFDAICNKQLECNTIINERNLFFDTGHLSAFGSKKIWQHIENKIKTILKG